MVNEGQRLLNLAGKTHAEIARGAGVGSKQTVNHWLRGTKVPSSEKRQALLDTYGIPVEAWDQAPTGTRGTSAKRLGTSSKPLGTKFKKTLGTTPPSTIADVDALLVTVRALRIRGLSQAETLKLVREERSLLRDRARLEEREELKEDTIVRQHPGWHRLRDLVLGALSKHPEAMAEVLRILEAEQAKP